jgi:hypothetical protein
MGIRPSKRARTWCDPIGKQFPEELVAEVDETRHLARNVTLEGTPPTRVSAPLVEGLYVVNLVVHNVVYPADVVVMVVALQSISMTC